LELEPTPEFSFSRTRLGVGFVCGMNIRIRFILIFFQKPKLKVLPKGQKPPSSYLFNVDNYFLAPPSD
jgi:hypothetical protein